MLSLPKHLYRTFRIANPTTAVKMLRQAQHDGRFYWLFLLLIVVGPFARAQEASVLRGVVLDADTHQPIPNAQVGIAGNRLGTSTNVEGRFALRVPVSYAATELEVALLGYRRYMRALPPLPAPELRIELKISPANLETVAVSSSVTSIIKEAVARIPHNYPTRPTRLTGFLRESDENVAAHEYHYLIEGMVLVQKAPYQHPRDNGQVKILEARKVDLRARQPDQPGVLPQVEWSAGPFVPHRFDFVHNRTEFIRESEFRNYQYRLTPQTTFQGRPVYVIAFGPKPGTDRANFAGELYIDEQSYAFLGAAWHRTPSGIRREHMLSFLATERAYRVDYQRYAGRWYLKRIWYNTLGAPIAGQTRRHLAEYLTTAIDTAQAPPIPYPERLQYRDVFLRAAVPYDSTFWNHYTTLLPPSQLQLHLLDQDRQRQAEQLLKAPVPQAATPLLTTNPAVSTVTPAPEKAVRLRYTYGVGVLTVVGSPATLGAVVAPAGYTFRASTAANSRVPWGIGHYSLGMQLDIYQHLSVFASTRSAFGYFDGSGWEAGVGVRHNLNPLGRPIEARFGLAFLRQDVGFDLGTFDNPDDGLRVAGTKLSADRLALSLQQLTSALQPRLGLGVELNHHWEAVADLGYLWTLRTHTQLLVEEKRGFFRNGATLDLPTSEVQLTVNNQLAARTPWQLGRLMLQVGLLHRLGR
jgi:hypothetical protein